MKFTNTITINRRPAEVFGFLARFENLPLWNYAISETRKITGGSVGVGSRYRQTRTLATPRSETFEVTEFEPDRRLSIDGAFGPFRGEVTYLLTPAGDGTALTNTMTLQPSGPLRFAAPLAASRVKSAVAANLDTLKQILEAVADLTTDQRGTALCRKRARMPRCRSGLGADPVVTDVIIASKAYAAACRGATVTATSGRSWAGWQCSSNGRPHGHSRQDHPRHRRLREPRRRHRTSPARRRLARPRPRP